MSQFSADSKLLVAEDDSLIRMVIGMALKPLKIQIFFAVDGLEVIEKTSEILPHLIFMDVNMPNLGGIDAANQIHQIESFQQQPIVAYSADPYLKDELGDRSPFCDYLDKPFVFNQAIDILTKYLPLK